MITTMSMSFLSTDRPSRFIIRLAVFLLICWFQEIQAYNKTLYVSIEAESRLLKDIFKDYDKRVRPVQKPDEPVHASLGLSLRALLYLNEKYENMETLFYLQMHWHDGRFSWNSSEYGGINIVKIPADDLWKPDFLALTSTNVDTHIMEDASALVYATGNVYWLPAMYLKSPCTVNLRSFPFDEQRCTIEISSYHHHGNHLNLTYRGGHKSNALDIRSFQPNTLWNIINYTAVIEVTKYSCCPEPYPKMKVVLTFKRNANLYMHTFVLPAILLGLLAPVSLLLPPESKERITLGSIVTLSIILINTNLSNELPAANSEIPAISVYYSLILLWSVTSVMCSVLILNLHHRGPRRGKVPDPIRRIFLQSLRRLVCLGGDSFYPSFDMEAVSMQGLQPPANSGNTTSKLEGDTEDVSRQLGHLSKTLAKKEIRQNVLDEWHQVALVIDRTLFLLFLFIYLMCSIILLA